jgi:hypothetical protein
VRLVFLPFREVIKGGEVLSRMVNFAFSVKLQNNLFIFKERYFDFCP